MPFVAYFERTSIGHLACKLWVRLRISQTGYVERTGDHPLHFAKFGNLEPLGGR